MTEPADSAGRVVRIQRKRTTGWRMPPGAIYVGRPTRWGNPFGVGHNAPIAVASVDEAIRLFESVVKQEAWDLTPLRGRPLACWCKLGAACHADVLLRLAAAGGLVA